MRRKGAGREMPEWEKEHLGAHMDDYFGPKEDDPAAEDAYEWGWLQSREFHEERITQLLQEIDRLNDEMTNLLNDRTDAYFA